MLTINKKEKQWSIDRAFNMFHSKESEVYNTLEVLMGYTDGYILFEELEKLLATKANILNFNRFTRSTATCYRSYGLIEKRGFNITESARAFVNKEITFQELLIMQLIKKTFIYNEDKIARPFFILFRTLLDLEEKNEELSWIDLYDYHNFLTELDQYDNYESMLNHLIKEKNICDREIHYDVNDFDIWMNAFVTTGLVLEQDDGSTSWANKKFTYNPKHRDFLKEIIKNEHKLNKDYENEQDEDGLYEIGKLDNGLFELMPQIRSDGVREFKNISMDYKTLLINHLIFNKTDRELEYILFCVENSNGFIANNIIKDFKLSVLNDENSKSTNKKKLRGVWYPYRDFQNFIKINKNYRQLDDVYNYIFGDNTDKMKIKLSNNRASNGNNIIVYGIPGCGKSYTVSKMIKDTINDDSKYSLNVFRTTFYTDYSNSDFIGQLLPKATNDNKVIYAPSLGPFSLALKRAYETDDMVYLIIEEINRGNAAAIFGDLFQLLDRLDLEKIRSLNLSNKVGDSEFPITNMFIEEHLNISTGQVIIPSNLTIYATMNTNDQNVFTIDTAFKRRWDMVRINDNVINSKYGDYFVPNKQGHLIKWKDFLLKINEFIIDNEDGFNLEDKQIGSYFVTDQILCNNQNNITDEKRYTQFNHKVLEYIWNDVAKFDRERWIQLPDDNLSLKFPKSFDALINLIDNYGLSSVLVPLKNLIS